MIVKCQLFAALILAAMTLRSAYMEASSKMTIVDSVLSACPDAVWTTCALTFWIAIRSVKTIQNAWMIALLAAPKATVRMLLCVKVIRAWVTLATTRLSASVTTATPITSSARPCPTSIVWRATKTQLLSSSSSASYSSCYWYARRSGCGARCAREKPVTTMCISGTRRTLMSDWL